MMPLLQDHLSDDNDSTTIMGAANTNINTSNGATNSNHRPSVPPPKHLLSIDRKYKIASFLETLCRGRVPHPICVSRAANTGETFPIRLEHISRMCATNTPTPFTNHGAGGVPMFEHELNIEEYFAYNPDAKTYRISERGSFTGRVPLPPLKSVTTTESLLYEEGTLAAGLGIMHVGLFVNDVGFHFPFSQYGPDKQDIYNVSENGIISRFNVTL